MVDTNKVQWCLKNGDLDGLKTQLDSSDAHVDSTCLTSKMPAIICASDYGQTKIVEYLIEKGSDVNIEDKETNITPLLAAIWENHTETVEVLLKNGAKHKGKKSPGGNSYKDEAESPKIKTLLEKY